MTAVIIGAFGIVIFVVAYTRGRCDGFHRGVLSGVRSKAHANLSEIADQMKRLGAPTKEAA